LLFGTILHKFIKKSTKIQRTPKYFCPLSYREAQAKISNKNPFFPAHWRQPKGRLALLQTAAFIGATLCDIIDLHGYAVRLFSVFVFFSSFVFLV